MAQTSNTNNIAETMPILVTKDVLLAFMKDHQPVICNIEEGNHTGWIEVAFALRDYILQVDLKQLTGLMMAADVVHDAIMRRADAFIKDFKKEEE